VGELLAARPAEQRQSLQLEIAWHFLRGGDAHRALLHGLAGAEEALRVGAPYEAERVLGALLRERTSDACVTRRIRILLARALVGQSKAEAAIPILEELLGDAELDPTDLADVSRMRASSEYLFNHEATGERYREAARKALHAARQTRDVGLTAQALFEYARAGTEGGDERMVRAASNQLRLLADQPGGMDDPLLLHALGFCHFFFFELTSAATCLERAISILKESSDSVTLNHVYNGLGLTKHYLCQFREAEGAYDAALHLAKRMGDDSRVSIIASNLSGVRCTTGDYAGSIEFGQRSIAAALRGSSQPRIWATYTNVAEAYILSGDVPKALECIQAAGRLVGAERSWRARVGFLSDSANLWLMIGNNALALDTIAEMERVAEGRERAAPDIGQMERLRIFRVGHTRDATSCCEMAKLTKERFRDKHPIFYLDALGAQAWAETRACGKLTRETETELKVFELGQLAGKRAALRAQGFLT